MTMKKSVDMPLRVSRFNYEIEHRSGTKMKHVDSLSRVNCFILEESLHHRLQRTQAEDEWIRAILAVLHISMMNSIHR